MRVLLSRERFANGLRIYGIDQDEQQEYAGRFCAYLGGSRVPIKTLEDAEAFEFDDYVNPDVVVWDLHERFIDVALEVIERYAEGPEAISFAVHAGEVVGLAGLVGAGRTELAEALFGVRRLIAGSVLLDGQPVRIEHPGDAVAHTGPRGQGPSAAASRPHLCHPT